MRRYFSVRGGAGDLTKPDINTRPQDNLYLAVNSDVYKRQDYQTGKKVLKILQDRSLKKNSTVIIVTHNAALAPIADKVIRIQDGKIKQVENNAHPQDIEKIEW